MADTTLTLFQKNKIMRVFSLYFDLNNDGVVEWKDFELFVDKLRRMNGWNHGEPNHLEATEAMKLVWQGLQLDGDEDKDGKVSSAEWCKMWSRSVQKKENLNLPDWQKNYMNTLFDINDTSRDGVVDTEEYTNVQMSFGMSQENCEMAFNTFAPAGKVDREQFKKLLIQYFYSDNTEEPGNSVFGMLPKDIAMEPICYGNDDESSANEVDE